MTPRLKEQYKSEVVPKLRESLGYANVHEVPRLEKVVVNMGVGAAVQDPKQLEAAMTDLALITGQKPAVTRAKKS
ncbi:MAG: 50S ribosomal protein L5, partial [Coriobacteriales bacterium]